MDSSRRHQAGRRRTFFAPAIFLLIAALAVSGVAIWLDTYAERLVAENPPTDSPAFPGSDERYDRSSAAALPATVAAYEATFGQSILGVIAAVILVAMVVLGLVTWRVDTRRR